MHDTYFVNAAFGQEKKGREFDCNRDIYRIIIIFSEIETVCTHETHHAPQPIAIQFAIKYIYPFVRPFSLYFQTNV